MVEEVLYYFFMHMSFISTHNLHKALIKLYIQQHILFFLTHDIKSCLRYQT